jgi:hypothetical protein
MSTTGRDRLPDQREIPARFQLSVWRPARPTRPVALFPDGSQQLSLNPDMLYEQIYAWCPEEEIWGGISDSQTTNMLRGQLIDNFNPYIEPAKRTMEHFAAAVGALGGALANKPSTISWSDCEAWADKSDQRSGFRANTALALHLHLQWVLRVFEHLPGATVTIR